MTTPLATFTPSLVEPETLERLFVAREPVLADLVERAQQALTSETRAHRMIVGPRGAGKTHLMSLAHHRISKLTPAPLIAWLSEDPWVIDGYEDLLRAIVLAATSALPDAPPRSTLRGATADELEARLRKLADINGPIIVLAENFDRILSTIDATGQRRLRGFLENYRALLLLVTATRLSVSIAEQTQPFYGFFSTYELQPLTVDEATDMLRRIAEHRGDVALAERLAHPPLTDRNRLQAIDALAGGQPRVWAVLGVALTVDGLTNLADLLLARFDDLTPYYQEQLGHLSAQERKAVRTLADLDHAVSVRDLAEELATDQRSVSKTITTLRRSGWIVEVRSVIAGGDGRLTYYELAEPLARLAFQIKDNRGEPLPMLVSLLSLWFSRDELNAVEPLAMSIGSRSYLAAASTGSELATHELAMGLGGSARSMVPDPLLLALADALEAAHGGEPERFFALPSTVRCLAERSIKDVGLEATWRNTIALSSGLPVWVSRVEALVRQGTNSLSNRSLLARLLVIAGRPTEAVALYKHILGECEQTLDANNQNTLETKGNLANAYWSDGRIADAIAVLEQLLPQSESTFGPQHPETLKVIGSLGNAYRSADRLAEAITLLDRAVVESERILGVDHPDTLISRQNLGVAYVSAGRIATANVLFDTLLKTADRILGTNHPKTLAIAHNLAVTYWMDERLEDSTRLLREVIDGRCLTLGPNHGDTLLSCFVLQLIQAELGRAEAT